MPISMSDMIKDYYHLLEIDYTASNDEIFKAYRKKILMYHPDINKNTNTEILQEIIRAYKILSDPQKRFEYNQHLIKFYQTMKKNKKKCIFHRLFNLLLFKKQK